MGHSLAVTSSHTGRLGVPLGAQAEGNMVEAAGRLFHSSPEWAGLCLHPSYAGMRSVLLNSPTPRPSPQGERERVGEPNPSVDSSARAPQPAYESLQGRPDVGHLPTPRRCPVATTATSGFTDVSSVFTLLSRAGATFDRTRVRKPYATRSTYVATSLFSSHATRRAGKTCDQLRNVLTDRPSAHRIRDLVSASPGSGCTSTYQSEVRRD